MLAHLMDLIEEVDDGLLRVDLRLISNQPEILT